MWVVVNKQQDKGLLTLVLGDKPIKLHDLHRCATLNYLKMQVLISVSEPFLQFGFVKRNDLLSLTKALDVQGVSQGESFVHLQCILQVLF